MFKLVGYTKAHYPEEQDTEEIVALFTTREKAYEYEKASRLSSYQQGGCWRGQHGRQYKHSSLLGGYCSVDVEEYVPEDYLIDPEPSVGRSKKPVRSSGLTHP